MLQSGFNSRLVRQSSESFVPLPLKGMDERESPKGKGDMSCPCAAFCFVCRVILVMGITSHHAAHGSYHPLRCVTDWASGVGRPQSRSGKAPGTHVSPAKAVWLLRRCQRRNGWRRAGLRYPIRRLGEIVQILNTAPDVLQGQSADGREAENL